MLLDAAKQGYWPKDIKEAVVEVLQPYFTHIDVLNKYACDSQLLSSFEFFIRYHNESAFSQGVKLVIDCYKNAVGSYNQTSWNIILSTYEIMVEDENKMWSVRNEKLNLQEDDSYEKMVQIFRRIGNVLEVSVKHIVQELYAFICLQQKGYADYDKIRKQDFGVVINNILDKGMLQSVLLVEPCGMKLSDWRNIAYHHTYLLDDNGNINCTYGRGNINNIKISMQELEGYLHKIIRSSNILNIARCIFIFDFIDDVPKDQSIEKIYFRQAIKREQFRIGLLSQEFQLGDILLNEDKVEIDLYDLNVSEDEVSRIVHCSQLLLNTWNVWKRKLVCINYIANTGSKTCCVYVDGDICKIIYEGKEDITYLANKFQIRYF
jgi:hypothetical protein